MKTHDVVTDQMLLEQLQAGHTTSFDFIMRRYSSSIMGLIVNTVKDPMLAEDLAQDTFLTAYNWLNDPTKAHDNNGNLKSWLCRIAYNKCVDYFRREKRKPRSVSILDQGDIEEFREYQKSSEDIRIEKEELYRLRSAIQQLPQEQRDIIELRTYGNDLTFREIAVITNVGLNTTVGRQRYALRNLKRIMLTSDIEELELVH